MRANRSPGSFLRGGGTAMASAGVSGPGPRQGGDVGASERGRAQGRRETLGVKQTVGAILVVGPGERSAEFSQDERFRGKVEIAVAPQRANDRYPLVGPPGRVRRPRGGDHSRA